MGTPFKMARPADENLPEVVEVHHRPAANPNNYPEVVPDTSPEFTQQRYYIETDKYPAYYDTAPKLPYEQPYPAMPSPEQHYHQPWTGGEHPGSAMISPNSSLPWQSFGPGADDQQTFVGSEAPPDKRICGVRKRLFIIIAVIVGLVVVGAAVGGGVGGSMAASQGSDEATAAAAETETNSYVFQHNAFHPYAISADMTTARTPSPQQQPRHSRRQPQPHPSRPSPFSTTRQTSPCSRGSVFRPLRKIISRAKTPSS
jgi:hypothetical protein